jgi:uncharacterized protein YheU (UPF0270 family)
VKARQVFLFILLVAIFCRDGTDYSCVVSLNPTCSSTCESRTRFFYLQLWRPFCAEEWNMLAICTTRDGTDYSCEVSLKSHQQFDL